MKPPAGRIRSSPWCWGSNLTGAVGDGTTIDRRDPTRLPVDWTSISSGRFTTCGIRTDSTRWCWGGNSSGTVGDGTTVARTRPTQLGGSWTSIASDGFVTCGNRIDASGGFGWCWGNNNFGQLGNGTIADSYRPRLLPLTSADASAQ